MDKKSELDCYLYFMWNTWNREVCIEIFGENIGDHIWEKWFRDCVEYSISGAPAAFYSELDAQTRRKIVERAMAHYNSGI